MIEVQPQATQVPGVVTETAPSAAPAPVEAQPSDAAPPAADAQPATLPPAPVADRSAEDARHKAFRKLASEKEALRKERDSIRALQADADFARQIRELRRTDPAKALQLLELDVETAARSMVAPDPLEDTRRELDALKAETRKDREEREAASVQSQIERGHAIVAQKIEAAADKYPFTHELGEHGEVFALMKDYYDRTGEVCDFDEAAEIVEQHVAERETAKHQARERAMQRRTKGTAAPGERPQAEAAIRSETERAPLMPTPTITHRLNGEAPQAPPAPFDYERHRRETMEAAIRGELK